MVLPYFNKIGRLLEGRWHADLNISLSLVHWKTYYIFYMLSMYKKGYNSFAFSLNH